MKVFERSPGRFYVLSHTDPTLWYHVKFWWEDEEKVYSCDCWDNLIRFDLRDCKHIGDTRKYEAAKALNMQK